MFGSLRLVRNPLGSLGLRSMLRLMARKKNQIRTDSKKLHTDREGRSSPKTFVQKATVRDVFGAFEKFWKKGFCCGRHFDAEGCFTGGPDLEEDVVQDVACQTVSFTNPGRWDQLKAIHSCQPFESRTQE